MTVEDKKRKVLHQLSQQSEPISLPELLNNLGEGYFERTVRRWLSELVEDGLVAKIGLKRGTKYQVIRRAERLSGKNGGCFSSESKPIIEQVRRPIYQREPIAYVDGWLDAYQPNKTFYIPAYLRQDLQQAGHRGTQEEPAGTYAHQIYNRLLIDLSFNSSRLEGNTYSLLETQKLLLEGTGAENKLDEEKVMILNHKEAIRYLVDNASKLEVTETTVRTLHYLLSDGLLEPAECGNPRDHGVRIGGSTYMPFERKRELEPRLRRIAEKAKAIENAYEQSLFLLAHISYLQAFSDVNKRTARLSANIPLIKKNLVPHSFNDVERDDYNSALIAIYELQDIRPLLDVFAFSYMRTCAMYDVTVQMLGFDEVRVRYRALRRETIREIILKLLTGQLLKQFIFLQAAKIPKKDEQPLFYEDVMQDLDELDETRLAGLGITTQQLQEWQNTRLH